MESSIVTPFCILLEVSTVRNSSKIRQLPFWGSIRQAYGRKFTIWKSRIALTPLKTLFSGSTCRRFYSTVILPNCQSLNLTKLGTFRPPNSCRKWMFRQLFKLTYFVQIESNIMIPWVKPKWISAMYPLIKSCR